MNKLFADTLRVSCCVWAQYCVKCNRVYIYTLIIYIYVYINVCYGKKDAFQRFLLFLLSYTYTRRAHRISKDMYVYKGQILDIRLLCVPGIFKI